jgi:hypothetical protein
VKVSLVAMVPPLSVELYRLTKDEGRPTVIGTDMHMLMGEMELERCTWDATTKTLSGQVRRPAGERGSVFICAPLRFGIKNPSSVLAAKDTHSNSLVIRVPLTFESKPVEWSIEFGGK